MRVLSITLLHYSEVLLFCFRYSTCSSFTIACWSCLHLAVELLSSHLVSRDEKMLGNGLGLEDGNRCHPFLKIARNMLHVDRRTGNDHALHRSFANIARNELTTHVAKTGKYTKAKVGMLNLQQLLLPRNVRWVRTPWHLIPPSTLSKGTWS